MSTPTPLRLLVITSRPLTDSHNHPIVLLDIAHERALISNALKNAGAAVDAHFLSEATTAAATEMLARDWDIVHITGHGASDGRLWFEDQFGVAYPVTAQDVVQMLGAHIPPVVVLSLCYSGKALPDALLNAGVRAVVAIDQDEPIPDLAATLFNATFYSQLAQANTVREAFNRAQTVVRIDSQVGNAAFHPRPGESEKPYAERFELRGDDAFTFPATVGAYQEFSIPRASGNFRARNRNFVGRAKEIVQIVKALDAGGSLQNARRVAIWGSGGLGKTELSQAVAWWYAERGRVDAILWASASPAEDVYVLRDLASLLSIAGRAFGLNLSEQMPFDQQKAIVRDFFAAHTALLIVDNWETLEGRTRKELWDFIKELSDTTRVLVTSRETLPPRDAANIELDTLAPEDAAHLFINIARNAGYFNRNPELSREQNSILGAIIERLGGYPLAVEVVAGQTESRSLDEIYNDLIRLPRNVLEGKDEVTGEPRGIWTSLDLSYNVLPDAEKEMFRGMGVLLAPATVEDIAAITQIAEPRLVLDTLVKRSLVRFREGHYALLPIVRDYAESCLADAGQDPRELHLRAVNYFVNKDTIESALTASDHLFELASRFQSRVAAQGFIEYLRGFYHELVTRGYWAEARRKMEELIAIAQALGDKLTEAQALGDMATMFNRIGKNELASALRKQAEQLYSESSNDIGVAISLHNMGNVAFSQGNYAEAMQLYAESMTLKQELGNKSGIAMTLHQMGNVAFSQGNYAEAMRLYTESMQLEQELGDKSGIARTLHQIGMVAEEQGNYAEAMQLYAESMTLNQELGDKGGIAMALHQIGNVAFSQGNYAEAMRLYTESMQLEQELGDKSGIAKTLGQMGNVAYLQDNYAEAMQLYAESMTLNQELGDKSGIASNLGQMGNVAFSQGNYAEAMRLYTESMQLEQELGNKSGIATTLGQLGKLAQQQGNFQDALRYFLGAFVRFLELQSPDRNLALELIGEVQRQVEPDQFRMWLSEHIPDEVNRSSLLEMLKNEHEQFMKRVRWNADIAVRLARDGSAEEKQKAVKKLVELEQDTRAKNAAPLADYFATLAALLAGQDASEKIAHLPAHLNEIAEQARQQIAQP